MTIAARIAAEAGPRVTDCTGGDFVEIAGADTAAISRLGIRLHGSAECTIAVADPTIPLKGVVLVAAPGAYFLFNNTVPTEHLNLTIRVARGCRVLFPLLPSGFLRLPNIYLRAPDQTLFWGANATSVDALIELEGIGARLFVGDDCMFSSGIWLRNFDMHSIFDIATNEILNAWTSDTVVERSVWFGADSCLLGASRVGYGSIIGARSMVTGDIPPTSLAVGTPARVVRSGVSWSRNIGSVQPYTREMLARMAAAGSG